MKRVLTFLAVAATIGFVSCTKTPADATITANDVTVEEGSTVQIGATTNSSAAITYASDNTAVATVSATGEVTGVAAGNANITLKVAAVKDEFTAAEKTIKVTVTAKPAPKVNLEMDGKFDDWAALEAGTYSQTFGDEDATHPVLTHCKVYANSAYIFVYFEYDKDSIDHEPDVEHVPFHCYINTDGDSSTGGFADQFSDACTDVLLEGFIYPDGASIGSYDPSANAWNGDTNGEGWTWSGLCDDGVCHGAGIEGKYEFAIDRAVLASVGFPVADEFSIGFDIQQGWNSVGILPNAAPSEDNPSGVVPSLKVKTQK